MTPLPDSEYAKIERLADKATPGPYHVDKQGSPDSGIVRSIDDARGHEVALATTGDMTDAQEARNADYFAALSPNVVLAMVAERRVLKDALAELVACKDLKERAEALSKEADLLANVEQCIGTLDHRRQLYNERNRLLVDYGSRRCEASATARAIIKGE